MTFIRNPAFEAEFERELRTKAAMLKAAEAVKVVAENIAPEGPTGDYGNSLDAGADAVSAYAATDDFAGHIIEWGSVNNPAFAPLRRAVKAAGLHLRELPKP